MSQPIADALDAYITAAHALDAYIKAHAVTDVYLSECKKVGTDQNRKMLPEGKARTWEHLYLELPDRFVVDNRQSADEIKRQYRDIRNVFIRSLEEVPENAEAAGNAIDIVQTLIDQNAIYKGEEARSALEQFRDDLRRYAAIPEERRNLFVWEEAPKVGNIGLLLMNLTQGMGVVAAVCEYNYEAMVASTDYKRSRGFKRRVLMDTERHCDGLQYLNSLQRRYATLDDISADDIAFRDQTATGRAQSGAHLSGELEQEDAVDPGRFSRVKEMGIGEFMDKVLPTATSVEVLLENHHASNMTSLTAPVRYERSIFKWWNGLSWSLADNITGNIRERVQSEGGRVDGALRFSIQWIVDHGEAFIAYDPYCILPNNKEIYGRPDSDEGEHDHDWVTGGTVDVKVHARKDRTPVANMIWPSKWRMMPGIYHLGVRYFPNLGGKNGFKAEIEFGGTIYSFNYSPELYPVVPPVGIVPVADITYNPIKGFSIKELLPSTSTTSTTSRTSSRELWGLRTNYFQPVSVIMDSPLYVVKDPWAGWLSFVAGTGAVSREISRERKWGCFFILKDCVNPEQPGFNTDCLRQDYRHLFEVYGNKTPVLNPENQLSGLGFSYKSRDSLIVRVKGDTERILRIRFNATIE